MNRREFLRTSGRWGAAAAATSVVPGLTSSLWAQSRLPAGRERMIVRSLKYLDLETPAHLLNSWITPTDLFFVRNHLEQPEVDPREWRLRVTGEVERPLELTLADLEGFEQATITNTLECAGNGRSLHRPRVPGIQWGRGAVGTAPFAGRRLAEVLRKAVLKASARHVLFDGADLPPGQVPDFVRSIPIEKAMDGDTLLATQMNGEPLRPEHGFPVRALVPGWVGAASVKWLTEVRVLDAEANVFFMKPGYRMPLRPTAPGTAVKPEETRSVTSLDVKSLIVEPGNGSHWKLAPIHIHGTAWAGEADIARVEVSTDSGRSWQSAALGSERARYAWRLWEHTWQPPSAGSFVLMARATDSTGRTQPLVASWNPSGYLWNAVEQVRVNVEA